ncbi:MAG: SDR family oxidoreductase [Gammaproteobacteria bacterium]|nr:SDR family oxidoreductase [Gammaproteobacteria bacterium]
MTDGDLAGQIGLITGGGAGIGRAIALEWAARGGKAVVADLSVEAATAVVSEIESAGGEALSVVVDVTDPAAIKAMLHTTLERFRRVDALFNVAGNNSFKNVEEAEDEEWQFIFDTNLRSIYRICKLVIPEMRRQGGGAIVNVASTAGILAENRCAAYTASKAGVIGLGKNMAMDFARDGIRVNTLCPGGTMTPRAERYLGQNPEALAQLEGQTAMKRLAQPEEIARPAVFLASPAASYITGAAIVVDGGMTAGKHIDLFDQ